MAAKRTVATARKQLSPPKQAPSTWSLLRRKAVYGWTKAGVQKQLVAVRFCGRRVVVHRKLTVSLAAVERQIRAFEKEHGMGAWIPARIECFNWRPIRGGTTLSRHAHAIALDIEPAENPYCTKGPAGCYTALPERVIQAFVDHGWTWGGSWNDPIDPMHFQRH